jgi:hypothetical protein
MQTITLGRVTKARCGTCGDGPVPPDVPAVMARFGSEVMPMLPIRSVAQVVPFDWKAKSLGEREPGEDG